MKKLKKANKGLRVFASIIAVLGIVFLAMGIFYINRDRAFYSTAVRIKADVVESNVREERKGEDDITFADVYIDYEYGGKEYKHIEVLKDSQEIYEVGEKLIVYVDPKEPTVALIKGWVNTRSGYKIAGIILLLIAAPLYALDIWLVCRRNKLKKHGYRVSAEITDVYQTNNIELLGKRPWVISCKVEAPMENRTYTFESGVVWNDLSKYFSEGEIIEVAVDPYNWKKYYVDLDKAWKSKKEKFNF